LTTAPPRSESPDSRRQGWLIAGAIFGLALILRLLWISVPINVDEDLWIRRGPTFFIALLDGLPERTYIIHHPGVTNMWIVGAGLSLRYVLRAFLPADEFIRQSASLREYLSAIAVAPVVPLSAYIAARIASAFVTAASFTLFYLLGRRIFGATVALVAAVILLLEPFFLAYQRSITTDANQANFTWICLLALLLYARAVLRDSRRGRFGWLILSGVFFGLAALSKVTAALTLPAIGMIVVWTAWQTRAQRGWLRAALDLLVWGGTVAVTALVVWPALRADPRGTFSLWYAGLSSEVAGHEQFLLGQATQSPGILYYPVILLARLSPLLLIGSLAGISALIIPGARRVLADRRAMLWIALTVGIMLVGVSLFDTKLDRYSVPVMPGLALLCAGGIIAWIGVWRAGREASRLGNRTPAAIVAAVVAAQLLVLLPHVPYYLPYFSPFVGGTAGAQKVLMVGNGELLDKAAEWLEANAPPDALVGMSWYGPSMAPYYSGRVKEIVHDAYDRYRLAEFDYVVLYSPMFQRRLPREVVDYFASQQPLHVVRWRGADYAKIYRGPAVRPEELANLPNASQLDFGGYARLIGHQLETPEVASGDRASLTLFWEPTAPFPAADFSVYLGLRDSEGNLVARADSMPVGRHIPVNMWEPDRVLRDVHSIRIPPGTPPGEYSLEIGFFSQELGEALEIRDEDGPRGNRVSIARQRIKEPPGLATDEADLGVEYALEAPKPLGEGGPTLLGYDWGAPTQVRAGDGLPLALLWRAGARAPAGVELYLQLVAGEERWQRSRGHPLGGAYPPDQWKEGELARDTWTALLPVDAPAGRYQLDLMARSPDGEARLATLGAVEMETRPLEFSAPEASFAEDTVLGKVARLTGFDILAGASACGNEKCLAPDAPLEVRLYWQALDEIERGYVRFVHLLDADGRLVSQSDAPPGGYPTPGWVPGEYITDDASLATTGLSPGTYRLEVGLYDPATGLRLTTPAGGDQVTLSPTLVLR